jgi:hypothetical protein
VDNGPVLVRRLAATGPSGLADLAARARFLQRIGPAARDSSGHGVGRGGGEARSSPEAVGCIGALGGGYGGGSATPGGRWG